MGKLLRSLALGALFAAVGCGSESEEDGVAGPMGTGGSDANVGGTGASTGGAAAGSGAPSATGGSTTGGGSNPLPTGAFDEGTAVAALGNRVAASLTITEDELELFFVHANAETGRPVFVLKRSSREVAFTEPALPVPELQAACAATDYPTIDVSNDGLRMYLTCLDGFSPLRLATRSSRNSGWVVKDEALGTVADSITVSDDELTAAAVVGLLTEDMPDSVPRPVLYQRSSTGVPFGDAIPIAFEQGFSNPDLGCRNRTLFGVIRNDAPARLAFSMPGASLSAYSAPSTEGMPLAVASSNTSINDYTPTVTPDCRRIYFLRATVANSGATYTVNVSERE